MRTLIFITAMLTTTFLFGQKRKDYLVVVQDTTGTQKAGYVFVNQRGDTVTRLDKSKYFICFSDTIQYFAVVGIAHKKGWWAIDKNEKLLFQVYNTSSGEPNPDELRNGMIRIIDDGEKIGFANYKGQIIIKPQFEAASSFYKQKAIIGMNCKQVLWCCEGKNEDKHYKTDCKEVGYINNKGQIQKIGNYTFEQIEKEIDWQPEDNL